MLFKKSLSKRITVLFLAIGLLPLGILSVLFFTQMRDSLKKTVANNFITLASEVGIEVERTVFTGLANIKTLSDNPVLRSENATVEDKLSEMRKTQDFYRVFEDITLVNLNGTVITSTTYNYRGAWKTKKWYQQAKEGLTVVSQPHVITGPYKVVMVTTAPIRDANNQIIAVVAGQISMEKIWEITDRVKLGRTGFVFILNKEGNVIAHPDKGRILTKIVSLEDILNQPSGTVEYKSKELGKQVCGFIDMQGYLDYKGQGWKVAVTQYVNEAYGIIKTVRDTVSFITLIFLVIIILVSIRLTGDITNPVKTLVLGTQKVAGGDLTHQITVASEDEIGQLALSFNQMTMELKKSMEKIEDYSRTLEQKVEERTRELKEVQLHLVQSAKMAAVGQLSAGVAHEINNPLGGILGYAQFILSKSKASEFTHEDFKTCTQYLEHIERESKRCKQIVENLLNYSRKSNTKFEPVDIQATIENTVSLLKHTLELQHIKITTGYDPNLPILSGNANQLQQIFTNLIINAQHAMPQGGSLDISTKLIERNNQKKVAVIFKDTGCGIAPENLQRIFEPFFTTKQEWKSLGLGLSISYQIIQEHNGEILVESEVGKGSVFTVVLPR